jgi:hypothetical protein
VLEEQLAQAQQVLDELFSEQLIPFKLSARAMESTGPEEYIVRFHDSRLRSVDISWRQGQSFKDLFRAAVLEQVKKLSGPSRRKPPHDQTSN